ncbi:hypothetical protein QBZ16_003064 [Prototheca wickerhamii]|uniref:Uncharacterized protein n=1 Tax=Prototheca wickerhamii TaxID=3111 RepID=A0AAD9IJC1_PROWI|nr:hypothetical protein QBZ16_003064 [Prototheca wickerhamii]
MEAGLPMASYQVCSRDPDTCLVPNAAGQTPVDLAASTSRGEVLNAMLLACSGSNSDAALAAMRALLGRGAVCDTWAPSGSSALMLTSSADSEEGVRLLLEHGATLELQDALGRTALMFAAGNGAAGATRALLDGGACLSARDRRGRGVLDYAGPGTAVRALLEARLAELESKSAALQAALLAEESRDGAGSLAGGKKKAGKKKKKGKSGAAGASSAARPAAAAERPQVKESSRSSSSASSSCTVVIKKDDEADVAAEVDHVDEDEGAACETPCCAPSDQGRQGRPDRELEKAPSHPLARSPSPDWQVVGASRGKEPRGASGRPAPIEARRPRGRVLSRPVSGQGSATPTASAAGRARRPCPAWPRARAAPTACPATGPRTSGPGPWRRRARRPGRGLISMAPPRRPRAQRKGPVRLPLQPHRFRRPCRRPRPSGRAVGCCPRAQERASSRGASGARPRRGACSPVSARACPGAGAGGGAPGADRGARAHEGRGRGRAGHGGARGGGGNPERLRGALCELPAELWAHVAARGAGRGRARPVRLFLCRRRGRGRTAAAGRLAAAGRRGALARGGTPSPPTFGEAEARGRGGFGPPVCGPYAGGAPRGLGNYPPGYDGSRSAFGEDPAPDSGVPGSGRASSTVFTLNLGTTC